MLFSEMIAEKQKEFTDRLCGQNAELLNAKVGCAYM